MSTNSPFPETAPDFSDPLGLLKACHKNILNFCDQLEELSQKIETGPIGFEIAGSAGKIYRYFKTSGKHHHDDEEINIFPILNRTSLKLADRVNRAKQEHTHQDELWAILAPQLANPISIKDGAEFSATAREFIESQRAHVKFEEEELFEMAQHLIGQAELEKIGRKMAERRGVAYRPKL
ncbi:MAG: hemerythrin domain-containing protein [Gammaproteobacteria bacterium]|nr:hemerythrin domain-containing protein [Gammaproteobacteria bacterium]